MQAFFQYQVQLLLLLLLLQQDQPLYSYHDQEEGTYSTHDAVFTRILAGLGLSILRRNIHRDTRSISSQTCRCPEQEWLAQETSHHREHTHGRKERTLLLDELLASIVRCRIWREAGLGVLVLLICTGMAGGMSTIRTKSRVWRWGGDGMGAYSGGRRGGPPSPAHADPAPGHADPAPPSPRTSSPTDL